MAYPVLPDEDERLHALAALRLLDTPQEERFDRITRLAQSALETPIALVSLVDADRQWFKSCQGLTFRETPRSASFCAHAIAGDAVFEIPDARQDPRFADNPLVVGAPHIRFYAGSPVHAPSGARIGTLCVIDRVPRRLDTRQRAMLEDLASWADLEIGVVEMSRAATDLDRVQRELASIFDAAAEGIVAFDVHGVVTRANPAAQRLTGWTEATLVGRRLQATLHSRRPDGTRWPVADCPLTAAGRGGQPVTVDDDVFWRRDGSSFHVAYTVAPLREGDTVTGGVVVFQDITARHEVERLKDEFISVVSHELRTPLTSIRASLGLLADGRLGQIPPGAGEMVDIALSNTELLVRLLNDVLTLERLSGGARSLVRHDVDLADVVATAVETVSGLASESRVTVEVDVPSVEVWIDPDRLALAVTNLLGNAVKFSEPGQTVTVTGTVADDRVEVAVTDRGRGIPADRLEAVFERFVQVDTADDGEAEGTGLGLAITRSVVRAHGGEVKVSSRLGEGSVFTIVLPR